MQQKYLRIIILIIVISVFLILTQIKDPQGRDLFFYIIYFDRYETNNRCNDIDGYWNWSDNVCIIIGPDISCERSNNNPICAEIKPTEIRQITFLESFYYD